MGCPGRAQTNVGNLIGFRAVIDAISRRRVPVIGHNALLDFAHTHARFLGPFPDDVTAFKRNVHEAFPLYGASWHTTSTWPRASR